MELSNRKIKRRSLISRNNSKRTSKRKSIRTSRRKSKRKSIQTSRRKSRRKTRRKSRNNRFRRSKRSIRKDQIFIRRSRRLIRIDQKNKKKTSQKNRRTIRSNKKDKRITSRRSKSNISGGGLWGEDREFWSIKYDPDSIYIGLIPPGEVNITYQSSGINTQYNLGQINFVTEVDLEPVKQASVGRKGVSDWYGFAHINKEKVLGHGFVVRSAAMTRRPKGIFQRNQFGKDLNNLTEMSHVVKGGAVWDKLINIIHFVTKKCNFKDNIPFSYIYEKLIFDLMKMDLGVTPRDVRLQYNSIIMYKPFVTLIKGIINNQWDVIAKELDNTLGKGVEGKYRFISRMLHCMELKEENTDEHIQVKFTTFLGNGGLDEVTMENLYSAGLIKKDDNLLLSLELSVEELRDYIYFVTGNYYRTLDDNRRIMDGKIKIKGLINNNNNNNNILSIHLQVAEPPPQEEKYRNEIYSKLLLSNNNYPTDYYSYNYYRGGKELFDLHNDIIKGIEGIEDKNKVNDIKLEDLLHKDLSHEELITMIEENLQIFYTQKKNK